jgi:hypothetical protein
MKLFLAQLGQQPFRCSVACRCCLFAVSYLRVSRHFWYKRTNNGNGLTKSNSQQDVATGIGENNNVFRFIELKTF